MAESSVNWWAKYGTIAAIGQTAIAALGFGAVLFQIHDFQTSSRAQSARQIYLAYMDLEFRNPQFAEPNYERIKSGDRETRSRYESFVSYLLYACEEALAAFDRLPEWHNTCQASLRAHLPFLCEKSAADQTYLSTFSATMASFVRTAMSRAGVVAPECKLKGA